MAAAAAVLVTTGTVTAMGIVPVTAIALEVTTSPMKQPYEGRTTPGESTTAVATRRDKYRSNSTRYGIITSRIITLH